MPWVTIKTGFTEQNGQEEVLREYTCDHPGCPNFATQILGYIREIRAMAAVCDSHSPGSKRLEAS
jgi:hypothetical protein